VSPRPEPDVDMELSLGRLALGREGVWVDGGRTLSIGISTRVVMPPAAAAAVALENPSQAALPGSQICTWVSTRPGSTTASAPIVISSAAKEPVPNGSNTAITPSAHTVWLGVPPDRPPRPALRG